MHEDDFESLASYWINNVGDQSDVLFVCKRYSNLPVSLDKYNSGILHFPVDTNERNITTFNQTVIKKADVSVMLDQISEISTADDVLKLASKYGTLHFDSYDGVSVDKKKRDSVCDWIRLSNNVNSVMDLYNQAHTTGENEEMKLAKMEMISILSSNLEMCSYKTKVFLYGEVMQDEDSFPQIFEYARPSDFFSFVWRVVLDSVISAEKRDGNAWAKCPYCMKYDRIENMHVLKSGLAVHHEHYRAWYEKQKRAEGKRNYKCVYCGKRDSLKNMKKMENKTNMYYHEKCMKDLEAKNKGQTLSD